MGDPFQQGAHSCSGPGSESCQNLGEYILIFLGLIISIIIGINVMTLLRCRLACSLNQIIHIFFQEDNTLKLTRIIPKKLLIHRPPARKQTHKPPVYQDPSVCRDPPICQNPTVPWKPPVSRNPAIYDLCTRDAMFLDLIPPGSCYQHSFLSTEPNQYLDARLPNGDDKVSQYWHPDNCQYDWTLQDLKQKSYQLAPHPLRSVSKNAWENKPRG